MVASPDLFQEWAPGGKRVSVSRIVQETIIFSSWTSLGFQILRIKQNVLKKKKKEIREKHMCTWTDSHLPHTSPFCKPGRGPVSALLEHGSSQLLMWFCFCALISLIWPSLLHIATGTQTSQYLSACRCPNHQTWNYSLALYFKLILDGQFKLRAI